jgi:hypothetical protein
VSEERCGHLNGVQGLPARLRDLHEQNAVVNADNGPDCARWPAAYAFAQLDNVVLCDYVLDGGDDSSLPLDIRGDQPRRRVLIAQLPRRHKVNDTTATLA